MSNTHTTTTRQRQHQFTTPTPTRSPAPLRKSTTTSTHHCLEPVHPLHQQGINKHHHASPNHSTHHLPSPTHLSLHSHMAHLNALIDEHLTWQESTCRERPTSRGTMFVDWDGDGEVVVSFRDGGGGGAGKKMDGHGHGKGMNMSKRGIIPAPLPSIPRRRNSAAYGGKRLPALPAQASEEARPLSLSSSCPSSCPSCPSLSDMPISLRNPPLGYPNTSLPPSPRTPTTTTTTSNITATYHPTTFSHTLNTHIPSYIAGHDADAHLTYDYDGRIMHVHGLASQSSESPVSAYYGVDVEKYRPGRGMEVKEVRMRDVGVVGSGVGKKKGVGRWVEKVLGRLEGMGLLGRLREDRWRERRGKG
ncbi:hypothetical protein DDE83_002640 [Stemphylium lycopersici]|uniref:Uncharacterized protein n=1 Tax=Stemphylium lycopersici TaxID=183478 RepID=A0A364N9I1_STELY|nr:hypothetical protein DDE83_002640 [Stemphylium lycopersici]